MIAGCGVKTVAEFQKMFYIFIPPPPPKKKIILEIGFRLLPVSPICRFKLLFLNNEKLSITNSFVCCDILNNE